MLRIKNAVNLDLTELTEETAKTIESIDNCVTAFFTHETVKLMPLLPFKNLVNTVVMDKDARHTKVNGVLTIRAANTDKARQFLTVNGKLIIDGDVTPKQLHAMLVGGYVNGIVLCGATQAEVLKEIGLQVNGRMDVYPDGAVLHTQSLKIDTPFITASAHGSIHYVTGEIDARDTDLKTLHEKQVTLYGTSLLVYADAYEIAGTVYPSGNIVCIPRGMRYVGGNITLDYATLRRLGRHIFLTGDCFVSDDLSEDMLRAHLEKLVVKGRLILREAILDTVLTIAEDFDDLIVYTGRLIKSEGTMKLSRQSLEGFTEPVSLWSEGMTVIAEDVPWELFTEKVLGLYIFGQLTVPPALHAAALMRAIRLEGNLSAEPDESSCQEKEDEEAQTGDVRVIKNAVDLKLV